MKDFENRTIALIKHLTQTIDLQPTAKELCAAYFESYGEACPRYKLAECLASLQKAGLVEKQDERWAMPNDAVKRTDMRMHIRACTLPMRYLPLLR